MTQVSILSLVCENESCLAVNIIDGRAQHWACKSCGREQSRSPANMGYWGAPPAGPLAEFDTALATITTRRGETYGHPADDFALAAALKERLPHWEDRRLRHIAEMICVKLARLAATPTHVDSLVDIAGYARCWAMILERDYSDGAVDNTEASE